MEQKIDELVKSYRNDMIQSLEELVKIPSVINLESAGEGAPFGQEIRSRPGCAYGAGQDAWIRSAGL